MQNNTTKSNSSLKNPSSSSLKPQTPQPMQPIQPTQPIQPNNLNSTTNSSTNFTQPIGQSNLQPSQANFNPKLNNLTSNRPAGTSTPNHIDPPIDQDDIEIQTHFGTKNTDKSVMSTNSGNDQVMKPQSPFKQPNFEQNHPNKIKNEDSDSSSDSDSDSDSFALEDKTYNPKIVIRDKPKETVPASAAEISNIMQGFKLGLGPTSKPPRPGSSRRRNDSSTSTESKNSEPKISNHKKSQISIDSETASQKTEKPTQPHQPKVSKVQKLQSSTVSQSTLNSTKSNVINPMRAASVPPKMKNSPTILQPRTQPNSRLPSQESDRVVPLAKGEGSMVSLEGKNMNLSNRTISPAMSSFSNGRQMTTEC